MRFRELRERSVDVLIGRILNPPLDDDLDAEVLFEDRLLVVAGSCSPSARRRRIAIEELMAGPYRGENPGPGKAVEGELEPRPGIREQPGS
jgi:DNA-binding transcriptional LysR family regulator